MATKQVPGPSKTTKEIGAVVTPLSDQPTLKDVVFFAGPYVAARWYDLGLALDVQPFVLDSVVAQQPMADQPRKMFAKWLEGPTGTGSQPRTWQTVLDAVGIVCGSAAMEDIRRAVQKPRIPTAATPKGAAPTGTNAADGQDGTTIHPRFAILTANVNEKRAVMHYLQLGEYYDWLSDRDFPEATGCLYKTDAFLQNKKASVVGNEHTLGYSTFTIEVSGEKVAGVHVHCDSYGPWGAFEKTVQLLTDVKSKGWPLKTIFVVGCCGASMSEQMKKRKIWCGTVLLAEEVNSYLHTGKAEDTNGVDGSETHVIIKGGPKHFGIEKKWLGALKSVENPMVCTGFGIIEVQKTMYLTGPLVIKNQLFGDNFRHQKDIVGVEMEVIGVIQAVDAIHHYKGSSKDERPGIVLAKGISDCTGGKKKNAKCVFFGHVTEEIDDDSRQVYATLQSIALVIRCVAKHIQEFYEPSHTM